MAFRKMRTGWRRAVVGHTLGDREMHRNGTVVQAELERQLAADDAYDSQATPSKIDGLCLISLHPR